jgi:prepilin-type N-terminal cleavage/methylation domain-containing protein
MKRYAFTMLELIFVIVIMGIVGKFGTEFLAQAYKNYIYSSLNNSLQEKGEMAVSTIAARLQYRIKDSVIARNSNDFTDFKSLSSVDGTEGYNILEWVGYDIEGFRGMTSPYWSGVIDLYHDDTNATQLVSPQTNTTAINEFIQVLSYENSNINDSALYFIGSNNNVKTGYGWDGNLTDIDTQKGVMHPIISHDTNISIFIPIDSKKNKNTFSEVDIYEYYQLAWSAYAIELNDGNLTLYYDYQPWRDRGDGTSETYKDAKSSLIMQNVSTFKFMAAGSLMKIQVCVKTNLVEEYSLCKEKTVF